MSTILYNPENPTTVKGAFFKQIHLQHDGLSQRHHRSFGGKMVRGILGPDLKGQENRSIARGFPWDFHRTWQSSPRPAVSFSALGWKLGRLLSSHWGGSGNHWENLIPLTPIAHDHFMGLKAYLRYYLDSSRHYDKYHTPNEWFGLYYDVRTSALSCALDPHDTPQNLLAYAPRFIHVSFRALRIPKPTPESMGVTNLGHLKHYLRAYFQEFKFSMAKQVEHFPESFKLEQEKRPKSLKSLECNVFPNSDMNRALCDSERLGSLEHPFKRPYNNGFDGDILIFSD